MQPAAGGSWRGPLAFGDPDFRAYESSIRPSKDLTRKSTSQTPSYADEKAADSSDRSAGPSEPELPRAEGAPAEVSELPSEPADFILGSDAEKAVSAPRSPMSEEVTLPTAAELSADQLVSETFTSFSTNSQHADEELARLAVEEEQRAYAEAPQRSKVEAELERNAIARSRKEAFEGLRAEGRRHRWQLLFGWFQRLLFGWFQRRR